MKAITKTKEPHISKVNKLLLAVLFVATLISLGVIIVPKHHHIVSVINSFASHHIFISVFLLISLITFLIKFATEYFKTNSLSWAGIQTYEYYKPTALTVRWRKRIAKLKRKIAIEKISQIDEDLVSDVLTNSDEKSKRYRDLLNAMSLGNNFKHKVKLHVMVNNKMSVIETTVWYANPIHVTIKGGKVIPVRRITKVEY